MKVLVIGGGLAGLAAATRLAEGGHHVTVVERRPHLGGGARLADGGDGPPEVVLGFHVATRALFERIGAIGHLPMAAALPFLDGTAERPRAAAFTAAALRLPRPLRGVLSPLAGLAGLGLLSLLDRAAAARVLAALTAPGRLAPAPSAGETVDGWLGRLGQPAGARRGLWHPLTRLTLRDDPGRASARAFAASLAALFFGSPDAAHLAVPDAGATAVLADPARRFLEARGGIVRLATSAERIRVKRVQDRLVLDGVLLRPGDGPVELHQDDAVIAAVPPRDLLPLLPDVTGPGHPEPYFDRLARLPSAPEVAVRLAIDRTLGAPAAALLVGGAFHLLVHRDDPAGAGVWLRAQGARELLERDDDALIALAERALRTLLPHAAGHRAAAARVLRRPHAVTAHSPGGEPDRPPPRTPVEGLFLAGAHVRAGVPDPGECAARSAEEAATLCLEYEPPPPAPAPTGLIPASHLLRRPSLPN